MTNNSTGTTMTKVFSHPDFGELRTIERDGGVWFYGKEVARVLGYKEAIKAIRDHVDQEDKGVSKMDTPGGSQTFTIINESGLYSLILSSKLPTAKKFKRWVTSEVLPSIRKNGAYIPEDKMKDISQTVFEMYMQQSVIPYINKFNTELENLRNVLLALVPDERDHLTAINIWKKNVGTPIASKIAEVYKVDIKDAYEMIYRMMWNHFGFSKGRAREEYLIKYRVDDVSTITTIADNITLQEQYTKSAIRLIKEYNNQISQHINESLEEKTYEGQVTLVDNNSYTSSDMACNSHFTVHDDCDTIYNVVKVVYPDMADIALRRKIYSQMANARQWKYAKTTYHTQSKRDVIEKSKTYKKRFVDVCNKMIQQKGGA